MKTTTHQSLLALLVLNVVLPFATSAQGFVNLDFEEGSFVPIPGDPYDRVQFIPAMPGWAGYVGTNQIDWLLYNNKFLGTAGIAIYGPDKPEVWCHGQYYVVLQAGNDPFGGSSRVNSAITQSGTIPLSAQSIMLRLHAGSLLASFDGQPISLSILGGSLDTYYVYGGDVSALAGRTGFLELRGVGYLDYIQFSEQPIPEPNGSALLGLGVVVLAWRTRRKRMA